LKIVIFIDILQILTNSEARKYLAGFQGTKLHIASANVTNFGLPKKYDIGHQENIS
jgi:hypothetical protein